MLDLLKIIIFRQAILIGSVDLVFMLNFSIEDGNGNSVSQEKQKKHIKYSTSGLPIGMLESA